RCISPWARVASVSATSTRKRSSAPGARRSTTSGAQSCAAAAPPARTSASNQPISLDIRILRANTRDIIPATHFVNHRPARPGRHPYRQHVAGDHLAVAVLAQRLHVQEHILGLAVEIDEAEPLHTVEPLDPCGFQRAGRGTGRQLNQNCSRLASWLTGDDIDDLDRLTSAFGTLNAQHDLRPFGHRSEPEDTQNIAVQQDVAIIVRSYHEAIALRGIEPFHMTLNDHGIQFPNPTLAIGKISPIQHEISAWTRPTPTASLSFSGPNATVNAVSNHGFFAP